MNAQLDYVEGNLLPISPKLVSTTAPIDAIPIVGYQTASFIRKGEIGPLFPFLVNSTVVPSRRVPSTLLWRTRHPMISPVVNDSK